MEKICFSPIGVIHSQFTEAKGIPRQSVGAQHLQAEIEIFDEFAEGLADLDGFSHIVVVFNLHRVEHPSLTACPPWDGRKHGVFATRSPHRPNPIGISTVKLEEISGSTLTISGVDMADGSPVLDIKPYVPDLNPAGDIRLGWLEDKIDGMNMSKSGDR
ncbi:S-adenosyl-L-methionine-binding protein [Limihaloglobus sulfuriphilus]|uniref:S-adenosyl-L-methionine-binding protein n=1 Tax=Limihaloglobus sulfuriphilus TaxID=1851148 RepID=A0A1Q2MC07_9BACT|nr:tRNA (N6-threonylcarbamoyladenosine(37)-N6)-methyltransferase TrmO [Limihaloglobus sulfuriphilus]AQQ70236.1 S-adenosyl-L-methionine-binding protein [Limihaloglobus sulfuriphilus]